MTEVSVDTESSLKSRKWLEVAWLVFQEIATAGKFWWGGGYCLRTWDLNPLGWGCGHAKILLKSMVNVICRMFGEEMVNSQKANPNSLIAETGKNNLEIS